MLSPLVSNGRLTSEDGSMIPKVRTDSRKLSPSTQNYDSDSVHFSNLLRSRWLQRQDRDKMA